MIGYEEKITVVARLPEDEEDISQIPASVTVITSEEIRSSGAQTVQELLIDVAGTIFFDDVGNGIETTVDLRGFNEGTAMAVLVDGVRINEPDDNRVNLEQIGLSSIERIEIYRGSSSSTFGAGAVSGTINIVTRNLLLDNFVEINAAYGSHQTIQERISGGIKLQETAFLLDLSRKTSNGFRENSDYDFSDIFLKIGGRYERAGDISLTYLRNKSSLGAPGSLTAEEMEHDRYFSPFNKVDGCDEKLDLLKLGFKKSFKSPGSFAATLFYRRNGIDTLTTGRWLMGFETQSDIRSMGFVSQYSLNLPIGGRKVSVATGVEGQLSDFGSMGYFTDANGNRYSASPDSSNHTDLLRTGIFVQSGIDISRTVSIIAGLRYDRDELDYKDLLQQGIRGNTAFSQTSFKSGATLNPSERTGFYFLYSEAFLPPTVYDLFAFPLFGSNPDLKPSKSRTFECGLRKKFGDYLSFNASLFRINMRDEVVFVIVDPENFTGINENVGKSRRDGLELSSDFNFLARLSGFVSYTYIDAEIGSGTNRGKRVPLVPENKIAAGISFKACKNQSISFNLNGAYVGSQYLTGDDSNSLKPLDSYTLVNARISKQFKKLTFFLDARNLLDEDYTTRGITNGFDLFFTPAPGRTVSAGIEMRSFF